MGLLDGGLAGVFASVMGTYFLDATLHRATLTDDGEGGGTQSFADEPVKAQVNKIVERTVEGVTDQFQSIYVLQKVTIDGAVQDVAPISPDDEITVGDQRWTVADVEQDPAKAYFDIAGRTSGIEVT